ncbi:MAG: hypothetical protein DYG92_05920 [Leptolyngbya sp. PLA1]|nr:hypothetical protein [Leptolyngbya sp. PLA1]
MGIREVQSAMRTFRGAARVTHPAQWLTALIAALLVVVFGYLGFVRLFEARGIAWDPIEPLFLAVSLFFAKFPQELGHDLPLDLQIVRFAAPWVLAYSIIWAFVRASLWKLAHFRLLLIRGHVLILGLNERTVALARDLRARGRRVVIVDETASEEHLTACRESGALLIAGLATSPRVLRFAKSSRASDVVVLGDSDSATLEAALAVDALAGADRPVIHAALGSLPLLARVAAAREGELSSRVRLFSDDMLAARAILDQHPLDHDGIAPDSPLRAYLVLAGTTDLAASLSSLAARIGHFANGTSVSVCILAPRAGDTLDHWLRIEPRLGQVVEFRAVDADPSTPAAWESALAAARAPALVSIFIDQPDESLALASALAIPSPPEGLRLRAALMLRDRPRLSTRLPQVAAGFRLEVIDPLRLAFTEPNVMLGGLDTIARAAHEHYLDAIRETAVAPGQPSHRPWDLLPWEFKVANRLQAAHVGVKARALGLTIVPARDASAGPALDAADIEALAACEHRRWIADKTLAGWTAGPVKDTAARVTPYLCDYASLPDDVKELDRRTVRSIPDLLARAGLGLKR